MWERTQAAFGSLSLLSPDICVIIIGQSCVIAAALEEGTFSWEYVEGATEESRYSDSQLKDQQFCPMKIGHLKGTSLFLSEHYYCTWP